MVIGGEKSYKHIDEGPIRSRRTRSPTAAAGENGSDDDGKPECQSCVFYFDVLLLTYLFFSLL